jgi:hypothetical protein
MSREQGPLQGMRPAAIAAGRRQWLRSNFDNGTEAAKMSLGAGAPQAGMRPGRMRPDADSAVYAPNCS